MLRLRIETKAYAREPGTQHLILRDISFDAASGEVIALLGPSGIGKTTVLRIILGLDGDFKGELLGPPAPVGAIFQEPRLLPWMSVAKNLLLVRSREMQRPDIAAALQDAQLPAIGAMMPAELSLGMARRAAIARAFALNPRTIIADEPFASLDRSLATRLGAVFSARAQQRGTLVLFSTHDLDLALETASRVLVLSGSPATLAGDIAVPADGDAALRARMHEELTGRFDFLAAQERN